MQTSGDKKLNAVSIPSMFRRLFLACGWKQMQNMLFYLAICHVLDAKRASFTTRKMPFYKSEDNQTASRQQITAFQLGALQPDGVL